MIGSSGAGKTTLASTLANRLGVPHLELDSIHHLENWEPIETETFRQLVTEFTTREQWVIDGNYSVVRDIIWPRADTVVFLDLPRRQVMSRLVPRTLKRVITRQELWNGNREHWQNLISRDPLRNLLVWSWTRFHLQRERFDQAVADDRWSHLTFVRLRSAADARRFIGTISRPDG